MIEIVKPEETLKKGAEPALIVVEEMSDLIAADSNGAVEQEAPAPLPTPGPVSDETAPAKAKKPRKFSGVTAKLPTIALFLAVATSAASVGGLLVANRTITQANALIEDASAREARLHKIEHLSQEIEALNHREALALAKMEQMSLSQPATALDVRRNMDDLQAGLARVLPATNGAISGLRDSQAELGNRIKAIYSKMDRIEQLITANRGVTHAAGREPTS